MRRARWALVAWATIASGCEGQLVTERDGSSSSADGGSTISDAGRTGSDAGRTVSDAGSTLTCAGGPLAGPLPGCRPSPVPDTGDPYADCVARINQFRWDCQCLPPLERWSEGESCADQHAEYDSTRSPHSGFRDRICANGGSAQNECPGWGSLDDVIGGCLQLMWDEGPGEPFIDHGHYINMSSTRYTRVACGYYTTPSGQIWAVQNFQ